MEIFEDQIMELSSAGGEKKVDGSLKSELQLLRMARSTATNGGRIIFFNMSGFDRPFLERLACVGKGNVYFDLR